MAYDGQSIIDIDVNRPDGDAEPKSILDDVTKEIKRVIKNTPYSWSRFENLVGSTLNIGDVVVIGAAGGLVLNDVQGSFLKHVVVVESIAAAAIGLVAREGGPVAARSAGAVTAFNYIRKSATTRTFEDMGIAVSSTLPIPNGAIGFSLEAVGGAGLCDIFLFERSSTSPTELSHHVLDLTNRTGSTVAAGSAVSIDPTNNNSVILNDVQGTLRPIVIAFESINHLTAGKFVQNGVRDVVTQGLVSRLHYLRKSATVKALESTGVSASNVGAIPPGSVGIALSESLVGGASTVSALLFGMTAGTPAMSLPRAWNLLGTPHPTSPTTKRNYISNRMNLLNPLNGSTIVLTDSATLTCDITVQGRNGRDQSNPFNPNNNVYFYATWDGTTRATRSSLNDPTTGPNLADGETHYVFLDVIRFLTDSTLASVNTQDEWCSYSSPMNLISTGDAGALETQLSLLPSFVPAIASKYQIAAFGSAQFAGAINGTIHDFQLKLVSGAPYITARMFATGTSDGNVKGDGFHVSAHLPNFQFLLFQFIPVSGFQFTYALNVDVLGYQIPR